MKKRPIYRSAPGKANFATVAMHYLHNNVYKSRAAAAMPIKKQIRSASPALKVIVLERVFTGSFVLKITH